MTHNEKEALLTYLEFNLVAHCEQVERHMDPDAVGSMYGSAYDILNEMERSLQDIIDFDDHSNQTAAKRS